MAVTQDVTERSALLQHPTHQQWKAVSGNATSDPNTDLEHSTNKDPGSSGSLTGNTQSQSRLYLIAPAVSIGIFMSAADTTVIVASYGIIGSEFQALNLTSWIATAYFLSLTSFQPLYGKLSDIFGRKACLMFAYVVFGLGTLACGLSSSIYTLIAGRVVQGIGGGGMTTVVSILFSDLVPLKNRGVWQGIINIVYSAGAAVGVALGGYAADRIGWRWIFLVQPPLCAVAIVTVGLALKLPKPQCHEDMIQKLKRIDFLGAIVLVGAVFCFLFGMDRGSNVAWDIPITYGPLAASAILFAIFMFVEAKIAREPFAPGHVIFPRSMLACYACYFFAFGAHMSLLYYVPLFYQAVDGFNAAEAGTRMLPAVFSSVSGSLFGGFMMKRTGTYYRVIVCGYLAMVIGGVLILLFTGTVSNDTWGISAGIMICTFGNGIGMTNCLIALIANAAVEDQAVATSSSYLFRQLGSTGGISLCSSIIQLVLRSTLQQNLGNGKRAQQIQFGVIVREAYGNAVRHAFVVIILASAGALGACLFIREKKLSR